LIIYFGGHEYFKTLKLSNLMAKSTEPYVVLLRHTPEPEKTIATAARMCY